MISISKKTKQIKPTITEKKSLTKDQVLELKINLKRSKERVEKLLIMEETISKKLADPEIYSDNKKDELIALNTKYAEVRKAITRAEDLWDKAQKNLDEALISKTRD